MRLALGSFGLPSSAGRCCRARQRLSRPRSTRRRRPRQTLDQQTPQVDLPDASSSGGIAGPRGDELGISVGAFTLFPSVDLNLGYDDNVFATTTAPVGSPVAVVRPSLELRSEWLNHSLRLLATGGFGYYASAPTQNFQNYLIQADGRLDIRTDIYATGMIAFRRSTEALGTPNVSFAQAADGGRFRPDRSVALSEVQSGLLPTLRLGDEILVLRLQHDQLARPAGGKPRSYRVRREDPHRLRGQRQPVVLHFAWHEPAHLCRHGERGRPAARFDRLEYRRRRERGSRCRRARWKAPSALTSQTYTASGTSTSASTFSLSGTWNGYEPLVLRPVLMRTINELALTNYQNYVSTVAGIDFTYDIHYPWKAVGGFSYNTADYTPASGVSGVNPRTDYFVKASLGLLYEVRPQYSIGPLYEYSQGWSTDVLAGGPQYSRNFFSIRLVAKR